MSSDQPPPDDPFRKWPQEPDAGMPPPPPPDDARGGPYPGGGPSLADMPPLAHRGKRLLARIIDGLLIGIPVGAILSAAVGGYDPMRDTGTESSISIVIALVYFVYEGLMLTRRGQTVGKILMKIRVAMLEDGSIPAGQPGWTRAAVYSLPEVVPCCGFIFWLVNVLWCTWDQPYHQCVHDKAARTVVVAVE